jgi:oligopeptide transport system substrate-binding protein
MKAKKTLALLLVVCMLVALLAGCADKSTETTTTTNESANATTTQDSAAKETTSEAKDGGAEEQTNAERIASNPNNITDYRTYSTSTSDLETFNLLHSQSAGDMSTLKNCYDTLLATDSKGGIVMQLAESYDVSDDGLTWTFHLRDNATWVDYNGNHMADVVASDWVYALEWVLNFYKNESYNVEMVDGIIAGVHEYYEYTQEMDEEDAKNIDISVFKEMVGIEAVDDYTLVYTLEAPCAYFASIACYNVLYPIPTDLVTSVTPDEYAAFEAYDIWYSGPYTITTFVRANEKVLTKNPEYWDTDSYRFNTVTIVTVESTNVAYQMWLNGEFDEVTLNNSILQTISETDPLYDKIVTGREDAYSFVLKYNFNRLNEDGTPDTDWNAAVGNEAFRKSVYYGLDFWEYYVYSNAFSPASMYNYTLTKSSLCATSDGTDYTDLVADKLGIDKTSETNSRLDSAQFEQYKKQAMEELTAQGVTFPITIHYYIASGNQTSLDTATVLKQVFETSLGSDYVSFEIDTYITSAKKEVYTPRLQSIVISGWGADYGDPINFLGQETLDTTAYYTNNMTNAGDTSSAETLAVFQEFTDMVHAAGEITNDLDARYEALADAEVFYIEHALVTPLYVRNSLKFTCTNDYVKPTAVFGANVYRYVNWETNSEGYTTEEYEEFRLAAMN